jgi:pimeloyl-ACP methyl ester carboxylesterase
MVAAFLPVTARLDGVRNEGAAIAPSVPDPLDAITAPILLLHARDDRLAPFESAARVAARVPTAELVAFDSGGHLLLGHHAEIAARVDAFWRRHLPSREEGPSSR